MMSHTAPRRRRGHNEGTISRRKDGRWEARLSVPDGSRKTLYGTTRREVQEKLAKAQGDVREGLPLPNGRQTVGQFLARWLEDAARPTVAPATYDSYRRMVERHILPELGKLPLEKLTPQRLQRFQAGMIAAGLSPRTVAYARAILRRALGQAAKWNVIARNPVPLVDPPKQRRPEARFLTTEEARKLMASLDGDRLEPLVLFTLTTGLRRGEVLSLRWRDLDLEAGTVSVEGQYQKWDGEWQWLPLKTAESRRTLALPPFVMRALQAHRLRQLEGRLASGERWEEFDLVFCTDRGTPLDGPNLTRQFQRRVKAAGITPIPFHGLRHSAATLLLARGLTLGQIQKILGHANIRLTADLYAHHVREIAERGAAEMQALFGGR